MGYFIVDVEHDGPGIGPFSMVSLGTVYVDKSGIGETFYGKFSPISDRWIPDALSVSGHTREEHLSFPHPKDEMFRFKEWILKVNRKGRPIFWSDNNGSDFAWVNWYFHFFLGENPFGWSSRRIGDLNSGAEKNLFAKWKYLRETNHDHNPVNDAMSNAEAFLKILNKNNFKW